MQRWRGFDQIPDDWGRCVLSIGVFDGVHLGHQALIGRLVERARAAGLPSVVMTFDPHPAEVVRPGSHPAALSTLRRRADLLAELGVDVFLVLPFGKAVSEIPPETFVHDLLVDRLHVAAVLVGENFRFGHHGAGDIELLARLGRRFGFTAEAIDLVDGTQLPADPAAAGPPFAVSSTYVRALVAAGDVRAAAAALGRPHRVEGVVVHGEGRGGSQLGYPTANLDVTAHAAIPADGIYAGWFCLGTRRSPTAISVGSNPTFDGTRRTVEAFVLDEGANFYGRRVALDFVERLRGQIRYDAIEPLVEQIGRDVARTREILGLPQPPPADQP